MMQPMRNNDVEQQQTLKPERRRSYRQQHEQTKTTNKLLNTVQFMVELSLSFVIAISLMIHAHTSNSTLFFVSLVIFNITLEGVDIFRTAEEVTREVKKTSHQQNNNNDMREFSAVFISHYIMRKAESERSYIIPGLRFLFVTTCFILGMERNMDSISSFLEPPEMLYDLLYQCLRIETYAFVFLVISRIISVVVNPLCCTFLIQMIGNSMSPGTSVFTRQYALSAIEKASENHPLISIGQVFQDGLSTVL